MSVLKQGLKVAGTNNLSSYFPVRTSSSEEAFDWDVAQGIVVRNIYKKEVAKSITKAKVEDKLAHSVDCFRRVCRSDFDERLDEPELWPFIDEMYFTGDAVFRVAPESLLFKLTELTGSSPKLRLGDMFSSLMQSFYVDNPERIRRNFIEQQVVDSLRSEKVLTNYSGQRMSKNFNEKPYLPFLTKYFKKDLGFLVAHPRYLIENLQELLKLYGYLYTAQLALNIKGWKSEPSSRPLFFIMENETASKERLDLVKNGHQKVVKQFRYLFPYLTISESLQDPDNRANEHRLPLWDFASKLTEEDAPALQRYTREFAEDRSKDRDYTFPHTDDNSDPQHWLNILLEVSLRQFDKGETRAAAQGKFIKSAELNLCSAFVKNRGQTGKVLVMNQDYLLLLTNLAIGTNDKLRFHELLDEFRARGVYFDQKTQQSLIQFYERVGNVERMSDSGDAVYVRKTV
ncbi:MAG: DNA phosphorothioation-dependent restriction protein DptG [Bacteroidetes bacterium]|nr:DNA phosphorothioation-dependent restriction protein DptG [Bacteroidota bacterium]